MQNLWRCRCRCVVDLKLSIREFKQTSPFCNNFSRFTLAKCVLTVLELNQRFRDKTTKLNICHHMLMSSTQLKNRSFHVWERTRTSSKCPKKEKWTCKACNYLLCKFVGFLLPSSSWLLKLSIVASLKMTKGLYKDNRCCVSGSVKRDNLRANKLIRVKLPPQNYKDQKKITSHFARYHFVIRSDEGLQKKTFLVRISHQTC